MATGALSECIKIDPPHEEPTVSGWYLTSGPELPLNRMPSEITCECLVIGAGWMGMHAARRYAELRPDAKVVLVDAGRIGNNASGRCMGFAIDLAHNPRNQNFAEDAKGNSEELMVNLEGNAYLKSAVEELGVDCDWDPQGKYHSAATEGGVQDLRNFATALDRMKQKYRWVEADEMYHMTGSRHYIKALHHPGTILLQPAKYLKNAARALPKNVQVYENTPVTSARFGDGQHVFETKSGVIRASKVILCTAAYLTKFGFYSNSAIPVYTFGSMTRELTESELKLAGAQSTYGLIPANSFGTTVRRTIDNRLLLRNVYSYANHCKTSLDDIKRSRVHHQIAFDRRWPELSSMGFESTWGGLLTLSQNGGMVFGELGKNIYGAAFCNGTGVSRGTSFGKSIAELATGRSSRTIEILKSRSAPSRAYPRIITSFGVNYVTGKRFKEAGLEV